MNEKRLRAVLREKPRLEKKEANPRCLTIDRPRARHLFDFAFLDAPSTFTGEFLSFLRVLGLSFYPLFVRMLEKRDMSDFPPRATPRLSETLPQVYREGASRGKKRDAFRQNHQSNDAKRYRSLAHPRIVVIVI